MKLKVIEYNKFLNYHICEDEIGKNRYVDLFVDGSFPNDDNYSLIGRTISCDYLQPYIEIAVYARLLEDV